METLYCRGPRYLYYFNAVYGEILRNLVKILLNSSNF